MTSEIENYPRPIQRQSGFNVAAGEGSNTSPPRMRTTTGGTIVRNTSFDDDVEMGDEKRMPEPMAIPGSTESKLFHEDANSSRGNNDLQTPPDVANVGGGAGVSGDRKPPTMDVKLPSLHSSLVSPRITTISSSHVSSGPASLSSVQWSPSGRSSDPHLYSISGQPYSNASVKPYLSTSFQTSAERGAGPSSLRNARSGYEDDVFSHSEQGLGLHPTGEPSPPQLRRSNDVDREEGDAAGVFSFSSPYFGPRSLDATDVPPLSPPPTQDNRARNHAQQRLMSPSWTAATLGKMSLGGGGSGSNHDAPSTRYNSSVRPSARNSASPYSRSLPSGGGGALRRPQPGPGMLHPHSMYQRGIERPRSTSRHRSERGQRTMQHVEDDETDEEMVIGGHEAVAAADDDATEDESEAPIESRYSRRSDEAYYATSPAHRHHTGQMTTMSASYERAQSGLSRQYSSDRYSHLGAISRHHPYAVSPSGASPSNAGGGGMLSYSPGNARGPLGRRRSSFGNGNALSGSPSNGVMQALSHSPRYIQSIPHRSAAPYMDHHSQFSPQNPRQSYGSSAQHYGESPDFGGRAYGSNRAEDEDDEEDEDEPRVNHRQSSGRKSGGRSTSASRGGGNSLSNDVESPEMVEVNAIRDRLGGAANCSAFISKLWYLMCRPERYSKYIHWSESGDSVILSNDPEINNEFAAEVLPKLFKHGNNASFVRQLNLYGFQRVPSSRLLDVAEAKAARRLPYGQNISTALQLYGPHSSFAHPRFKKDQEALLPSMKPRSSKKPKKSGGKADSDGEDF